MCMHQSGKERREGFSETDSHFRGTWRSSSHGSQCPLSNQDCPVAGVSPLRANIYWELTMARHHSQHFYGFTHLVFLASLRGQDYYQPHFTDEETEAQRSEVLPTPIKVTGQGWDPPAWLWALSHHITSLVFMTKSLSVSWWHVAVHSVLWPSWPPSPGWRTRVVKQGHWTPGDKQKKSGWEG